MASRIRLDYRAMGEVLNSEMIEAALRERAEKVMARAVETAPFDPENVTHFKDAFHVETGTHGGLHHDRAYAKVVNTDDAAVQIEFGTKDTRAHRTLGRAADAARD